MKYDEIPKEDILYEDDVGYAVLGRAVLGHVKIYPRKDVKKVEELDDEEINHLFTIANITSTVVFETLGAQGTNVVAHSNNQGDVFFIDVLPRSVNDDINLRWEPRALPEPEVTDAFNRIKDKCDYIGVGKEAKGGKGKKKVESEEDVSQKGKEGEKSESKSQSKSADKSNDNSKDNSEEEDDDTFMTRHLNRSP